MHTLSTVSIKSKTYIFFALTMIITIFATVILLMPKPVNAIHINGNWVPTAVENEYLSTCTASQAAGKGYTISAVFPNPSTLTTSNGISSTNLFAASLICSGANYTNYPTNIEVTIKSFSDPYQGTGNISVGSLPSVYSLGSLNQEMRFTNSSLSPKLATLTNLSGGYNCWTVYFDVRATYGTFVDTNTNGRWDICVFVNYQNWDYQPSVTRAGTTNGPTATTVAPGGEVTVDGNTFNAGAFNGSPFNFKMRPITAHAGYVTLVNNSWNHVSTSNPFSIYTSPLPQPLTAETVQWGRYSWGTGNNPFIPTGQSSPRTWRARWQVNSTVPDGTNICFQTQVSNYNNAATGTDWRGVLAGSYACFRVVVPPPPPEDFAFMKVRGSGAHNGAVWNTLEGCRASQTIGPTSRVEGQNRNGIGTSVEYGLTSATSLIINFASAIVADQAIADQENLTFANDPNAGEFLASSGSTGSPAKCLVDLYTELDDPAIPTQAFGGAGGIRTASSVSYIVNNEDVRANAYLAKLTGNTLGSINNYRGKAVVLVDGNLNINGNITYDPNYGTAANLQVPSLVFIVIGDINIAAGVTQLDGLYMSIPDGSDGGNINTCRQATGTVLPDICNDAQLTINGAFVSDDVDFYRFIYGQAYAESQVALGLTQDQFASEIFEFSPELYIARPFAGLLDSRNINNLPYEYFSERTPVF